ncbi:MAG: hypothetical protein ACSHYF_14115 [Verrucomicrobiaceae bacterium]
MTSQPNPEEPSFHELQQALRRTTDQLRAALENDSKLSKQFEEEQDQIAGIWQAHPSLHEMPLEQPEVIEEEELTLPPPAARPRRSKLGAIAACGWLTATALGLLFTFPHLVPSQLRALSNHPADPVPKDTTTSLPKEKPIPFVDGLIAKENESLKEQILDLHTLLETARSSPNSSLRPTITPLYSLGNVRSVDPAQATNQLLALIEEALVRELRRQNEIDTQLVIAEGWNPNLFSSLKKGELVRHRNFLDSIENVPMLIDDSGSFYDPASSILWTPAEDGGGYLGKIASSDLDLTKFEDISFQAGGFSSTAPADQPDSDLQGFLLHPDDSEVVALVLNQLPFEELQANEKFVSQFTTTSGEIIEVPLSTTGSLSTSTIPVPANLIKGVSILKTDGIDSSVIFTSLPDAG